MWNQYDNEEETRQGRFLSIKQVLALPIGTMIDMLMRDGRLGTFALTLPSGMGFHYPNHKEMRVRWASPRPDEDLPSVHIRDNDRISGNRIRLSGSLSFEQMSALPDGEDIEVVFHDGKVGLFWIGRSSGHLHAMYEGHNGPRYQHVLHEEFIVNGDFHVRRPGWLNNEQLREHPNMTPVEVWWGGGNVGIYSLMWNKYDVPFAVHGEPTDDVDDWITSCGHDLLNLGDSRRSRLNRVRVVSPVRKQYYEKDYQIGVEPQWRRR